MLLDVWEANANQDSYILIRLQNNQPTNRHKRRNLNKKFLKQHKQLFNMQFMWQEDKKNKSNANVAKYARLVNLRGK